MSSQPEIAVGYFKRENARKHLHFPEEVGGHDRIVFYNCVSHRRILLIVNDRMDIIDAI